MDSFGLPALAIKPPEQEDLLGRVGKITQLKSLLNRQQMQPLELQQEQQKVQSGQLELQQQQQDMKDRQTVQQVLAQTNGDMDAALPQLAGKVSPKTFMGLQKAHVDIQKDTAEIADKQLKVRQYANEQLSGVITQAQSMDPQQYAQNFPQIAAAALKIKPELAGHIDPSKPIPQDQLGALGLGVQTQAQYEAKELAKRQAEAAAAELPGKVASSQKAVIEAQAAPAQTQANLSKTRSEAAVAGQKAKLGVGGVAAAEAAGKIQGEMGAMGGTAAGAAAAPNPNLPPGQKDEAYLSTLQGNVGTTVKAIAEGRMPLPSGFALKSPYWQNMLSMVAKYDPSFDAVNYNARAKTRNDFTSGKSAAQVNALNTVIGHLDTLSQSADKLGNSWSPTWNSVANAFTTASGKPQVKNFEVTKNAVTDELTRVWRQSGGTEADIQSWEKQLNASGSPEQLHSAIAQIGELLHSKLDSMQNQVQQGMGTDEIKLLTPKSQQTLGRLSQKAGGQQAAPTGAPITATGPNGHKIMVKDGRWVDAQTGAPIQ